MSEVFDSLPATIALALLLWGLPALPARVVARLDGAGAGWCEQPSSRLGVGAAMLVPGGALAARFTEGWLSPERAASLRDAAGWGGVVVGAVALVIGAWSLARRSGAASYARRLTLAASATATLATIGVLAPAYNAVLGLVGATPGWWVPWPIVELALCAAPMSVSATVALTGLAAVRAGAVARRGVRLPFRLGLLSACVAAVINLGLVVAAVRDIVADPHWSTRAETLLSVAMLLGLMLVFVAVALIAAAVEFSPSRWTRVDVVGCVAVLTASILPVSAGFDALRDPDQVVVVSGVAVVTLITTSAAPALLSAYLDMCRDRVLVLLAAEHRMDITVTCAVPLSLGPWSICLGVGLCARGAFATWTGQLTAKGWQEVQRVEGELAELARRGNPGG